MVAATSFSSQSVFIHPPSSLSNPTAIRTRLWVFFISPVGEKNFSRGSANFHPHWRCKGTKNRDAKQAFFKFFSDLFQMLKCEILRIFVWRSDAVTQLRSYAVSFALVEVLCKQSGIAERHKDWNSIYIILIYYNILYNIKFTPQESATMWNT